MGVVGLTFGGETTGAGTDLGGVHLPTVKVAVPPVAETTTPGGGVHLVVVVAALAKLAGAIALRSETETATNAKGKAFILNIFPPMTTNTIYRLSARVAQRKFILRVSYRRNWQFFRCE